MLLMVIIKHPLGKTYTSSETVPRIATFLILLDTVIYLAGKHVVEYDIIRKRQSYITKSIEDEAVTAMNYYRTKKNVLKIAVGLKGNSETLPHVLITLDNFNHRRSRYITQEKITAFP